MLGLFFPQDPDRGKFETGQVREGDCDADLKGRVKFGDVPEPFGGVGWNRIRVSDGPGDYIARARLITGAYSSGLSSMIAWIFSITASTTACL